MDAVAFNMAPHCSRHVLGVSAGRLVRICKVLYAGVSVGSVACAGADAACR